MVPAKPLVKGSAVILIAGVLLSACSAKPARVPDGAVPAGQEASYLAPPRVEVARTNAGGVVLSGAAPAGGKVRLATPGGQAMFAPVGPDGHWTMALPLSQDTRIFGLSATIDERRAQAEGYVLVAPGGQVALLRAGAGALRIDRLALPGLRAIDFDRAGGLEVSVAAAAGATVVVRLDGRKVAEGRADSAGRYQVSLGSPDPIHARTHQVQASGEGFSDEVTVQVSPPAPLAEGPLHSQLTSAGLRVDWMTPGGGVQSTLLVH